jgi:predicted MFS family arabinose efflux permease
VQSWYSTLTSSALVHLELFFDVSTAEMSLVFPLQAVAALIGTTIGGLVFDHVNQELAFAVASLFQGLSTTFAPCLGGLVPFIIAVCISTSSGTFMYDCE